jgi:glucokinase
MIDFVLAGDIGGTKTALGLYRTCSGGSGTGAGLECLRSARFVNKDYASIVDVIKTFLGAERWKGERVASAALGVAGVVADNACALTNIRWDIDGEALRKTFSIERVMLVNDLVATAHGIETLGEGDLFTLQKGVRKSGNMAVIAAGTGLGESIIVCKDGARAPFHTEGGHADFAPRNRLQQALLNHFAVKFGHVGYDRIVSGPGLVDICEFLLSSDPGNAGDLARMLVKDDAPRLITERALSGEDRLCAAALDLFVSIYGAEAGNLALKAMATGGVYVGGGIAPLILDALKKGAFMRAFVDKGRFKNLLKDVPVRVILNPDTALSGAALLAAGAAAGS